MGERDIALGNRDIRTGAGRLFLGNHGDEGVGLGDGRLFRVRGNHEHRGVVNHIHVPIELGVWSLGSSVYVEQLDGPAAIVQGHVTTPMGW